MLTNEPYCKVLPFKYYVLTLKNKYNVRIVLMLHCKTLLLLLRVRLDTGVVVWVGLRVG